MASNDSLSSAKSTAILLADILCKSLTNFVGVTISRSIHSNKKYDLCVHLSDIDDKKRIPDDFDGYKIIIQEMDVPKLAVM